MKEDKKGLDILDIRLDESGTNLIAYWRNRRQGYLGSTLSQEDLAMLLQINRNVLNDIEQGKSKPDIDTLFNIAAVLEIPPHVVFAPLWKKARERMNQRRTTAGFGKAYARSI